MGGIHGWAIMNNAAVNVYLQVFAWMYVFLSFEYNSRTRVAGLCGKSVFSILRNYQTIFQNGFTIIISFEVLSLYLI